MILPLALNPIKIYEKIMVDTMEDISIVNVETQKVVGIRKQGKYALIADLIPQVYEYAASKNVKFNGPPIFVCHEMSLDEVMKADEQGTADIEIAVPVEGSIDETDEIKCYELHGGKMAKILHKGPYDQCQSSYEKLISWILQQGMKINGPMREVYLNDPREVSEAEILTEIYAPVE